MAAARGKTAEEATTEESTPEAPAVDEAAPLSQEDRQGALANLLGADVVAPAADVKPAEAPDMVEESTPEASATEAGLSAVVTSTRFHVPTEAGRKTYRKGQTVTAAREVIERGVAIGCLKANG